MSMAGSMRIGGGTGALTDALVDALAPQRLHLNAAVTAINDGCSVTLSNGQVINASNVVVAVPPRVAAQISFDPRLPDPATKSLKDIPTWMGAHAKFVAVYPTPFWRAGGLSGDASSRRGPLAEIHDASPMDGSIGALFGFLGLPAEVRAQAGATLEQAALAQLVNLFGPQAGEPLAMQLEDWSQAHFTAAAADATAPAGHPPYAMPQALRNLWNDKIIFAVTELSSDNGGLIEGALAAAEAAAKQVLVR
jgi:monoamine oxidase